MKAIVLTAYGTVDHLELQDVAEPRVGPDEIKVRMAGASINPIDMKVRSGIFHAMMPLTFPAVLGRDASGEVLEIGARVSGFAAGARVMGIVNGAYAEIVVAKASSWVEIPKGMDEVDAAALPLVLLTGSELIDEATQPKAGDVVLVTGAVGSVGRVAVFAAKARGAKVWAGVRSRQKAEAASLGADGVVALDSDAEIDAMPRIDALADTVGGPTVTKLFRRLKPGAVIASVVGEPDGAKGHGFIVRAIFAHPDAARLSKLAQAVADGRLVIPIAKRFPLSEAREASRFAEQHAGGKVILTGAASS